MNKKLEAELKRIKDFFDNMSIEEFDDMLERNGINEITSAESEGKQIKIK